MTRTIPMFEGQTNRWTDGRTDRRLYDCQYGVAYNAAR